MRVNSSVQAVQHEPMHKFAVFSFFLCSLLLCRDCRRLVTKSWTNWSNAVLWVMFCPFADMRCAGHPFWHSNMVRLSAKSQDLIFCRLVGIRFTIVCAAFRPPVTSKDTSTLQTITITLQTDPHERQVLNNREHTDRVNHIRGC